MAKMRLLFEKDGAAKYISHLDLMRTFQRLFLRSGMFIKHTQGYHPHPIMSIVLPLPVAQTSVCELLDFEITEDMDYAEIPKMLNSGAPDGLKIVKAYEAEHPVRDLALIDATVTMEYDGGAGEETIEVLRNLFNKESIVIQKRTKRKELADVDLAPMIKSIEFAMDGNNVKVHAVVSAQNPGMNPALLGKAIEVYCPDFMPDFIKVHRNQVLDASGKPFR